jgi:hypothetical protein
MLAEADDQFNAGNLRRKYSMQRLQVELRMPRLCSRPAVKGDPPDAFQVHMANTDTW